jgi:hypothetical protein
VNAEIAMTLKGQMLMMMRAVVRREEEKRQEFIRSQVGEKKCFQQAMLKILASEPKRKWNVREMAIELKKAGLELPLISISRRLDGMAHSLKCERHQRANGHDVTRWQHRKPRIASAIGDEPRQGRGQSMRRAA